MLWTVLPAMVFCFNGHGEVKPELEQQLKENILFGAVGLEVFDGVVEASRRGYRGQVPMRGCCWSRA